MSGEINFNLKRPLVFFDVETTGTNVTKDRIIELSYIKIYPDGKEERQQWRFNPEMHVPEASTNVHHITDNDLKDKPTFKEMANEVEKVFQESDIAGYNSNKFDVPLLIEEFARCQMSFDVLNRHFIDVQNIFHKMEQRTLVAAYKFYCGKNLDNAHSAMADTEATYEVLKQQLVKYPQLGREIEELAKFSKIGKNLDLAGRVILDDNDEPVFNFGKHKGKKVKDVLQTEPSFFDWILQNDFPKNTKDIIVGLRYKFQNKK